MYLLLFIDLFISMSLLLLIASFNRVFTVFIALLLYVNYFFLILWCSSNGDQMAFFSIE